MGIQFVLNYLGYCYFLHCILSLVSQQNQKHGSLPRKEMHVQLKNTFSNEHYNCQSLQVTDTFLSWGRLGNI